LSAVKRKTKLRINYKRLSLTLLCVGLIAYGVYLLTFDLYELGRGAARLEEVAGAENSDDLLAPGAEADENPFAAFYYYEEDRQNRYENYATARLELTPNEVVWRVGADLDRPAYTDVEIVDDFRPPVLLNKHRKLSDDYVPRNLVNTSSGRKMTPETRSAYEALRDAAGLAGHRINAYSAYKSIEYQKGVYNKYVMEDGKDEADEFVARAGHSEHHLGTAIDLIGSAGTQEGFQDSPEAEWVAKNAWQYGFIVRYTDANADVTGCVPEPWHITYVGTDIAADMHSHGIDSLEEYTVKYIRHTPKK
jgi:hypothetical protein